jgi:hypothetical protein
LVGSREVIDLLRAGAMLLVDMPDGRTRVEPEYETTEVRLVKAL